MAKFKRGIHFLIPFYINFMETGNLAEIVEGSIQEEDEDYIRFVFWTI